LDILYKILDSKLQTLDEIIDGYTDFYCYELANKEHVILSLDDTLDLLKAASAKRGRVL
jgi:hypothetical protein